MRRLSDTSSRSSFPRAMSLITWSIEERLAVLLRGLGVELPAERFKKLVDAHEVMEVEIAPDPIGTELPRQVAVVAADEWQLTVYWVGMRPRKDDSRSPDQSVPKRIMWACPWALRCYACAHRTTTPGILRPCAAILEKVALVG